MPNATSKRERGRNAKAFRWTAQEWAVLSRLPEAARVSLALRAVFAHRTLLDQARSEGLIDDDARANR